MNLREGVLGVPANFIICHTVTFELGAGLDMAPLVAQLKGAVPEFAVCEGENGWDSKIVAEHIALLGVAGNVGVWIELRYCGKFVLPAIINGKIQAPNMASVVFHVGHAGSWKEPVGESDMLAALEVAGRIQRKFSPPVEQMTLITT